MSFFFNIWRKARIIKNVHNLTSDILELKFQLNES